MEFYLIDIGIPVQDTGKMLLLKAEKTFCHTSEFIFSECFPSVSTAGKI